MKYAIVNNNKIQDINANPTVNFHPTVAAMYDTEVADTAKIGDELIDGVWTTPEVPEPIETEAVEPTEPEIKYAVMSPIDFKMCLTSAERIAIAGIKDSDPILVDAFSILEDPRLTEVDMNLESNRDLIKYLISLQVIGEDRYLSIVTGVKK